MQELASVAGMTTGTVYNHFKTKEEVASAVALLLADTLCRRINDSQQGVAEGAQRMAIGNQRYIWLAEQSPQWALMMLDVAAAAPELLLEIRDYVLADLRLGVKQKVFRIPDEAAAMDLINGTVAQAMRSVALGLAPPKHGREVASCVLRGLGMDWAAAKEVACGRCRLFRRWRISVSVRRAERGTVPAEQLGQPLHDPVRLGADTPASGELSPAWMRRRISFFRRHLDVVQKLRVLHQVVGQVLAHLVARAHGGDRLAQALPRVGVDREERGRDVDLVVVGHGSGSTNEKRARGRVSLEPELEGARRDQPPFLARLPGFFLLRVAVPRSRLTFWPPPDLGTL